MADKESTKDFTQREMEIMAKAWSCMTEEPKVNYDKLAEACGMTNKGSAANAWRNIKAKIMAKVRHLGVITEDGDSPAKKPTPRKRGKAADATADDGESPTKKAKGGRKGKASKAKEESIEADGDVAEGEEDAGVVKPEPEEDGVEFT